MKAVDITLLFQAINFFLVYCILSRYVFYPAMHILKKQESAAKSVYVAISKAQEQKDEAHYKKQEQWATIKKSLHALIPNFAKKFSKANVLQEQGYEKQQEVADISVQQKENMKKIMAKQLVDIES